MTNKNYIDSSKDRFKYLSKKKIENLEAVLEELSSIERLDDSLISQISDYMTIQDVMGRVKAIEGVVVSRTIYFKPFRTLNEILKQISDTLGREILKDVKNGRTSGAKSICIALKNMKR